MSAGATAQSTTHQLWMRGAWSDLIRGQGASEAGSSGDADTASDALYRAIAHLQVGEPERARTLLKWALDHGLPRSTLASVLTASVHNTLGKLAAAVAATGRVSEHFRSALDGQFPTDPELALHARTVTELAGIGLSQQAAGHIGKYLQLQTGPAPIADARWRTLKAELDLLQHELSLALQRGPQPAPEAGADAQTGTLAQAHTAWRERLSRSSTSQLGQDLWVLDRTNYKSAGFFVEFGATDGVLLSNSYLLEKQFAWTGICAEPNPEFFQRLRQNRSCITVDACVAAETGTEVDFVMADAFGGIDRFAGDDLHADVRSAYRKLDGVRKLRTISLHDLLVQHDAPREIDYISIDTEGSEYEILRTFPFGQWNVRLFTIEHNHAAQREPIRVLLESHGYRRQEASWDDWYWRDGAGGGGQ